MAKHVVVQQAFVVQVSINERYSTHVQISGYKTVFIGHKMRTLSSGIDEEIEICLVTAHGRWQGSLEVGLSNSPYRTIAQGSKKIKSLFDLQPLELNIDMPEFERFSFEDRVKRPSLTVRVRVLNTPKELEGGLLLTETQVQLLELLRKSGPVGSAPYSTEDLIQLSDIAPSRVRKDLRYLRSQGLIDHTGGGGRYGPAHWYWLYPR